MVHVPIIRANTAFGRFVLESRDNASQIKDADLKFLAITASQLAMTLENLDLLEETQKAYAGLKELQDETIRLETIATKGMMSAEIGHEMNNFVGVVAGNLSLLEYNIKKGNFTDLQKYTTAMADTIEKIKKFTANLMDLRPISSEKTTISFDRLLAEVIDYLKPQKRFRDVSIAVNELMEDVQFDADPTQMQQLLYNFFNNAADATADSQRKQISVTLNIRRESGTFRFSVADTGCGIPPELLQRAFHERFTTKESGHGFGLVVCKRIIDNHGGRLHVDSTPGTGTTITVEFPLSGNRPLDVQPNAANGTSEQQVMIPTSCGFRAE
jgi:signal transduction histidine kinase